MAYGEAESMTSPLRYSIVIQWSDEDQAYLVTLPEWGGRYPNPATHGESYQDALVNALEVLAMFVDIATERGEPLPAPGSLTSTTSVA
jgi:predicted RNase H-like HicB family nuclease